MKLHKRVLLVLPSLAAVLVGVATAQTAHVRQGAKLRREPSTDQPPIRVLVPPETVKLPGFEFRDGYYRVQTNSGETGWVWAQTLELGGPAESEGAPIGQVTVTVASKLRSDPSTRQEQIGLVQAGTVLSLVAAEPQNGFYKVHTPDGREAWVWTQNVTLVASTAPTKPTELQAATPTAPAPTMPSHSDETPTRTPTRPAPPWFPGLTRPLTGAAGVSPTPTSIPPATPTPAKRAKRKERGAAPVISPEG